VDGREPGRTSHWEGDLLFGTRNSQIATLVERLTRYVMLVKVDGKDTETVAGFARGAGQGRRRPAVRPCRRGDRISCAAPASEVRVINGISAGFAVAASLGVSLTHRDHCHGITFVTAHSHDHGEPTGRHSRPTGTTLAIYMGMNRIGSIAAGLLLSPLCMRTEDARELRARAAEGVSLAQNSPKRARGPSMRTVLALLLAVGLSTSAMADSVRVGNRVIADDDPVGIVVEVLGKPDRIVEIENDLGAVVAERWEYFREGKTIAVVVANSKVISIREEQNR
jgi:hypothetical protein